MNKERIYRSLYLIRRAEEEVVRIYPTDKIKSPVHLSIGQEAVSVGVCEALKASDVVFGTYRSHALYLAKTGDLKGFFRFNSLVLRWKPYPVHKSVLI